MTFHSIIWEIKCNEKNIYLTFDDGPQIESTPVILDILKQFDIKATFFCTGQHVESYPELFADIQHKGHQIGHHGFVHLNGWTTSTKNYQLNIEKSSKLFQSVLFRPPYGKITWAQKKILEKKHTIVMWNLMPGDFDSRISKERCLQRSIQHTKAGTIVVFHDNSNSIEKLNYVLPEYIDHFKKEGYKFKTINLKSKM